MSSRVDIINEVLPLVSLERITDPTQDAYLNAIFDPTRQSLLRAHEWGFAKAQATLTSDVTVPLFGYKNRFLLPSDCLRILSLYHPQGHWLRKGKYIHSNDTTINLEYIQDITDTGSFDALFEQALVYKLAAKCAVKKRGSPQLATQLESFYKDAMKEAFNISAKEESLSRATESNNWLISRLGDVYPL